MRKKIVVSLLVGTMVVTLISGCGKKKDSSNTEKKAEVETTAEIKELKKIGDNVEGAYQFELTNATGQEITGVSIKSSGEESYPANMLEDSDKFEKDETRIVYYKATEDAKDTETESGKVLPAEFTVQLTFADNKVLELHSFPLDVVKEGKIELKDEVAYLVYIGKDSKDEVNTFDAELAVKAQNSDNEKAQAEAESAAAAQAAAAKEQAEAAARAEAAAQAEAASKAEAAAQAEAAQAEAAAQAAAAAQTEAPAPTQAPDSGSDDNSDDGCIDDGLFY